MKKFDGTPPSPRCYLSADALIQLLRRRFKDVPDSRRQVSVQYSLVDVLCAAFAMFSLKEPSLLQFEEEKDEPTIKKLYQLDSVASDTTMRETLDGIDIEPLNEAFADIVYELRRGGILRKHAFHDGHYLLAIDGVEHFSSDRIHCKHCLQRNVGKDKIQYYHQAIAAVIIHPDLDAVYPLAVEPIVRQDGETKNDCERNATRRLLQRVRQLYPRLKLIVVEDGLSSNAPHIADLKAANMRFLLGAKPGDHAHLFDQVIEASDEGRDQHIYVKNAKRPNLPPSEIQYVEDLALNASNPDVRVNFLQQLEYTPKNPDQAVVFSWVTDMELEPSDFPKFARGGRGRWRIENETFNTLKNLGYHFEHNFGHGEKNLATVLMLLMFLAFFVDQVQQACCPLFQAIRKLTTSRIAVWNQLRCHVMVYEFESFTQLWTAILTGECRCRPPPVGYA